MQRSCNVKNTINAVRCKGVHYVPPGCASCVLVTDFTPLYIHTTPEYRYFIQQKINCKNTKHWFILHPRPVIPTNADMQKFTKVPSYFILPGFVFFFYYALIVSRVHTWTWGKNSFDWGCKEIPRTVLYILLLAMSLKKSSTGQLSETYILTGSVISMYLQLSNNSSNGRKKNNPDDKLLKTVDFKFECLIISTLSLRIADPGG